MLTSTNSKLIELEKLLDQTRSELEYQKERRKSAECALRETLAAMIQHQQVGKCGNFRYNTVTGEIKGTAEAFKMFCFPPETYGCTVEEWVAKIHPDDRSRIHSQFLTIIKNHDDMRFEYRIVVGSNEVKYIRCDGEPDLEFAGDFTYFGVLTDITERRAAEAAHRAMEAELATALRLASMGELAGSIIHEISQPLSAVSASAQATLRWLSAGPSRIDRALISLERVLDEGQRAATIISGLKLLIRNVPSTIEPFEFDTAIREVCALLLAELSRKNILLETKFKEQLPLAMGNRVQIQQIFMNLARNAIEAMQCTKKRRVFTVSINSSLDMLSLRVADTGTGIAPEMMERLFTPLYTTKVGGMGLGLSISRKIALANGGTLVAEPSVEGSVFHLQIPIQERKHG